MSENDDNLPDERLEKAWHKVSAESSPPGLDRDVLRVAERAVRGRRWFSPGLARPLAFAATMVLGVGLLWRMQTEVHVLPQTAGESPMTEFLEAPAAPSPGAAVADAAVAAASRQERGAPAGEEARPAGDAVADEEIPAARRAEIAEVAENLQRTAKPGVAEDRLRQQVSSTDAVETRALPGPGLAQAGDASRQSDELAAIASDAPPQIDRLSVSAAKITPERQAARGDAQPGFATTAGAAGHRSSAPDDEHCTREQRERANDWWDCIVRLRDSGLEADAEREREALEERYPDFTPPE